ncbi:MAG: helix-turn-helix transcriptional regulator [Ruminococcus sp.]|nr:helix-turn-helix transcriptional regulator [Ruminococcus sp.]
MRENAKSGALTEVTFQILLAVYSPLHGYGIMQLIEERTGGRLILGAGSLYGALNTLCAKEWIKPSESGEKREYIITEKGKAAAEKELERLKGLVQTAEKIIGGYDNGR